MCKFGEKKGVGKKREHFLTSSCVHHYLLHNHCTASTVLTDLHKIRHYNVKNYVTKTVLHTIFGKRKGLSQWPISF